ncbi:phospholipid scramblase 2-like [Arapaima gigas]
MSTSLFPLPPPLSSPLISSLVFLGCESNNEYKVKNSLGQNIYNAKEKNDCCTRNFCGPLRCLEMNIKDHVGKEVIRLIRPFRCVSCWYPCFLQEMEVQAPPGTTVGYVIQNWHPFLPRLSILGPSRELLFKVEGPCLLCRCCGTVKFQVKDKDGEECIGHIKKYSAGLIKRCFTDANNFSIKFPVDTDVKIKAVFLGACILIVSGTSCPCDSLCLSGYDLSTTFHISVLSLLGRTSCTLRKKEWGSYSSNPE